jgi:hypothetical protein
MWRLPFSHVFQAVKRASKTYYLNAYQLEIGSLTKEMMKSR